MLKKLAAFFVIALIFQNYPNNNLIFENAKSEYVFYVGSNGSNCKFIYSLPENANETKKCLKNVTGEGVKNVSEKYINEILKKYNAKQILIEEVSGVRSVYYYSDKITNYKIICGKKVNIQTAFSNDVWNISSPMIYGSF